MVECSGNKSRMSRGLSTVEFRLQRTQRKNKGEKGTLGSEVRAEEAQRRMAMRNRRYLT